MARKFGIKRQEAFNKKVEKIVLSAGAKEVECSHAKQFNIKTQAGKLRITLHNPSPSELFSVFTQFEEPEKANKMFPHASINPYSGKMNFHMSGEQDALDAITETLTDIKL